MQKIFSHKLSPLLLSLGLVLHTLPGQLHAQGLRLPGAGSSSSINTSSGAGFSGGLATAANAAAAASGERNNRQADFIIALVNSEPITNNDLQGRKARAIAFFQAQGRSLPPESALDKEILDSLIAERLQLQEAKAMGTTVDDVTLEQAEQNVAQQNGASVSAMYQELASEGIGREQFRTQLRNQLTLMRLRERAVDARVRITDQELDQYLRENPVELGTEVPDSLNLGHILVLVPENASPEEEAIYRKKIDEAASRLAAGEDFAAVAQQFSDAAEKDRGGELGMRPANQYPELFLENTASLENGAITAPIRSGAGFHILKILERQAGSEGMIIQNHARHILISPNSGLDERQASQLLREIRQRVVQGKEDFATLAREYSQDPGSAPEGGDLGWAGPGQFVPEFETALSELNPGDVSQPIVSRFGMHLIQLLDRKANKLTQRDRREMVREKVREQKAEKAFTDWVAQLRSRAYVEIRDQD